MEMNDWNNIEGGNIDGYDNGFEWLYDYQQRIVNNNLNDETFLEKFQHVSDSTSTQNHINPVLSMLPLGPLPPVATNVSNSVIQLNSQPSISSPSPLNNDNIGFNYNNSDNNSNNYVNYYNNTSSSGTFNEIYNMVEEKNLIELGKKKPSEIYDLTSQVYSNPNRDLTKNVCSCSVNNPTNERSSNISKSSILSQLSSSQNQIRDVYYLNSETDVNQRMNELKNTQPLDLSQRPLMTRYLICSNPSSHLVPSYIDISNMNHDVKTLSEQKDLSNVNPTTKNNQSQPEVRFNSQKSSNHQPVSNMGQYGNYRMMQASKDLIFIPSNYTRLINCGHNNIQQVNISGHLNNNQWTSNSGRYATLIFTRIVNKSESNVDDQGKRNHENYFNNNFSNIINSIAINNSINNEKAFNQHSSCNYNVNSMSKVPTAFNCEAMPTPMIANYYQPINFDKRQHVNNNPVVLNMIPYSNVTNYLNAKVRGQATGQVVETRKRGRGRAKSNFINFDQVIHRPTLISNKNNPSIVKKEARPKHFDVEEFKIGLFKVFSSINEKKGYSTQLKIIFSKRRFIYEFQYPHCSMKGATNCSALFDTGNSSSCSSLDSLSSSSLSSSQLFDSSPSPSSSTITSPTPSPYIFCCGANYQSEHEHEDEHEHDLDHDHEHEHKHEHKQEHQFDLEQAHKYGHEHEHEHEYEHEYEHEHQLEHQHNCNNVSTKSMNLNISSTLAATSTLTSTSNVVANKCNNTNYINNNNTCKHSKHQMFYAILVPFDIITGLNIIDHTVYITVNRSPCIFGGSALKSKFTFEKLPHLDPSLEELKNNNLHTIVVRQSHIERLRYCLIEFDVRFKHLLSCPIDINPNLHVCKLPDGQIDSEINSSLSNNEPINSVRFFDPNQSHEPCIYSKRIKLN